MAEARLPISVCLIASNEARRIRGTLESVAVWAGEIVVVLNDDVNDGTDQIAESFGAKVFREPWKGFGAQKNSAAAKCTQPWLLNLDADEVVSPDLQKEIAFAVSRADTSYVAYEFPRCTFFCGRWIRHGDWYPDRVLRLWRRGTARWSEGLHERLEVKGRIGRLYHDLLHHSMESLDHLVLKTLKYVNEFTRASAEKKQTVAFFDILFRPLWRFWRGYLFRLGFLDGWQGFTIAWFGAFYTFLRYASVYESQLAK